MDRRRCIGLLAAALVPAVSLSAQSRTIALLFDSLVSPFWLAAIERMRDYARRRRWSTLEAVSNVDDHRQLEQARAADSARRPQEFWEEDLRAPGANAR